MRKLAMICDLVEENWPSMDLAAEMLLEKAPLTPLTVSRFCPAFVRRFQRLPRSNYASFNADRLLNRLWDYPKVLKRSNADFDLFHICDHSYAHLVHVLPKERTGVFCHDLDTFRCILEPEKNPRAYWFRKMTQRILSGLQNAAKVFFTTDAVRDEILRYGLVDESRLVKAPYGLSPEFCMESTSAPVTVPSGRFVLHVGSCIPRKRIDVLLDVFAELRATDKDLALVQVGGEWTQPQRAQISKLGIEASVMQLPRQGRDVVAELCRRASLVLMPSELEGFGLPVIEALACGAVVVASDIPPFREVGADAVIYCPLADIYAWAVTVRQVLSGQLRPPELSKRLARAQQFSWDAHADSIYKAYESL